MRYLLIVLIFDIISGSSLCWKFVEVVYVLPAIMCPGCSWLVGVLGGN
jgi:hypothetical protein